MDNPYAEGIEHVELAEGGASVRILDQTQLPNRESYKYVATPEECFAAIKRLEVRGAPCIGIFAGYALYVLARRLNLGSNEDFSHKVQELASYLNSARPTAVNLSWALNRMLHVCQANIAEGQEAALKAMHIESLHIHQEDIQMCRSIAEYGLTLLRNGDGILTHCNAGPLATSRLGTALGPILLGHERGLDLHVYADETRPLLQGARLTTYELSKAGVDVTLICDNMASMVMKNGWVQACFVGCDRIAANGDFANKIGTSGVAILAKHYNIPFYTLGPSSTVDLDCQTGADIKIE
ncbi:MAG: S-methyl-5-thioribose-1-phosphate isomerase, partial [Firmicutes bacterium]|nr:S-methyl-5-thioribose-1-phosphate isomerase [Bacillota bacterium]